MPSFFLETLLKYLILILTLNEVGLLFLLFSRGRIWDTESLNVLPKLIHLHICVYKNYHSTTK
jgi:hypothetical protein